jgi:hypothetical protein
MRACIYSQTYAGLAHVGGSALIGVRELGDSEACVLCCDR